jgi:predicted RNase H-like nuclease (RuvC/YqgF family)
MKNGILWIVSMIGLMCSCNLKRYEVARRTMDSLRAELKANRMLTSTMGEVGAMIDSIDISRKALNVKMIEGTNYESFISRMHDINRYVRKTEQKIEALEKIFRKSNDAAYASAIKKLRGDLQILNQELKALKEQIAVYKNEKENLVSTVSLQNMEIQDKLNQIKSGQQDVDRLRDQVNQLLVKSSLDQGEDFFARALAVEETANRTRFAPRKKKKTQEQALDLYKLALAFGKGDAQAKITALERKM